MNWNSKSCSDVAKEQIWKEYVRSEQQSVRIFDQFRSNSASLKRQSIASPVSNREADFLNKSKFLFRSIYSQAGIVQSPPMQRTTSPLSSITPSTNTGAEGSPVTHPLVKGVVAAVRSPSAGMRSSTDGGLSSPGSESPVYGPQSPVLSSPASFRVSDTVTSPISEKLPPCYSKPPRPSPSKFDRSSQSPARGSTSVQQRPTSGSEYGAMLEPLVKHRLNPFHYGIRKSDVTR